MPLGRVKNVSLEEEDDLEEDGDEARAQFSRVPRKAADVIVVQGDEGHLEKGSETNDYFYSLLSLLF